MLLFNVLATAGWGVFVLTLFTKWLIHHFNGRRQGSA